MVIDGLGQVAWVATQFLKLECGCFREITNIFSSTCNTEAVDVTQKLHPLTHTHTTVAVLLQNLEHWNMCMFTDQRLEQI